MTDYDKVEQIKIMIQALLDHMGIQGRVEFEDSLIKGLVFNIHARESRLLIGHQGTTLHALEILCHALAARQFPGPALYFSLDVDDYKRKREWSLREMANNAADQVKRTGKPVTLEPMPNYDRRLIHSYLQERYPELHTISEGREPYRRIIVTEKIKS